MIIGPALGGFLYSIDKSLPYVVAGIVFLVATVPVLLIEYQRGGGADARPADVAPGARRTALHPTHSSRARGDLARPVRGAVRRCGRPDPGGRRGSSRRRRRRLRLAARGARDRRRSDGDRAGRVAGPPPRRADVDRGRRDVRPRHDRVRHHPQLRGGVRRARRALGRRHGLDVHPRVARAARDARRPTRPRDVGRGRVHRCLQRARRVRERCCREPVRCAVRDRRRWGGDGRHRRRLLTCCSRRCAGSTRSRSSNNRPRRWSGRAASRMCFTSAGGSRSRQEHRSHEEDAGRVQGVHQQGRRRDHRRWTDHGAVLRQDRRCPAEGRDQPDHRRHLRGEQLRRASDSTSATRGSASGS